MKLALPGLLLVLAIGSAGCAPTDDDPRFLRPSADGTAGCDADPSYGGGCKRPPIPEGDEGVEETGETSSALQYRRTFLWGVENIKNGITQIAVCWETPGWAEEKAISRVAVAASWSAVALVNFYWWKDCTSEYTYDVRIRIADEHPHVKHIGSAIRNVRDGMLLNFTFQKWGAFCQEKRDICMHSIAMHEFGHALGFLHEQNRTDAVTCQDQKNGQPGVTLGPYDPESIMNYCGPTYEFPHLTPLDVAGVQQSYRARPRTQQSGGKG